MAENPFILPVTSEGLLESLIFSIENCRRYVSKNLLEVQIKTNDVIEYWIMSYNLDTSVIASWVPRYGF